jgi:hypothetical protein
MEPELGLSTPTFDPAQFFFACFASCNLGRFLQPEVTKKIGVSYIYRRRRQASLLYNLVVFAIATTIR